MNTITISIKYDNEKEIQKAEIELTNFLRRLSKHTKKEGSKFGHMTTLENTSTGKKRQIISRSLYNRH